MGDDTFIIVPPVEPEPEVEDTTYEALGEELLARLDRQLEQIEGLNARIIELEGRMAEFASREYAEIGHSHEGFAEIGHTHDGYATIEHQHEKPTEERKPDKPPEKQHPYFRKVSEF